MHDQQQKPVSQSHETVTDEPAQPLPSTRTTEQVSVRSRTAGGCSPR
jgi:hypothetical protein